MTVNEARHQHFALLDDDWTTLSQKPADETIWESVSCCCGSPTAPRFLFEKKGTRFVRCPDCTTVFVNPQLTEEALADHFTHSPAWEAWSRVLLDTEQMAFDRRKYDDALDEVAILVRDGPGRVLDVGANSGIFLSAAMERGWNVDGVEPSRAACQTVRDRFGIDVFCGTFADFDGTPENYDLITFWASLEYTKHPDRSIDRAVELLAPGGLLLIFISGNSHSLVMRMLQEKCIGYLFNRSWYFSPKGLDALVVRPGIECLARHSIISSLDVIERYLEHDDPYGTNDPSLFSPDQLASLESLLSENHMGYKFQSIYRKSA